MPITSHPYGWLSLIPPLTAIGLALVTRKATISLLAGVLTGAIILAGGNPVTGTVDTVTRHLWPAVANASRLQVFAFTLLMGAMVGVISASGGMRNLVDRLTPWAHNRRRGQLLTWALGLVVFFDDYANTLLLGTTLRGLCDRLRISREKLAYLVDSTSAPVAGLALVSTWVATEIDLIQQGLDKLSLDFQYSALTVFVQSIPYRFYVLWALIFVPLVAWLGRDFGPMHRAEQKCLQGEPPEETATDTSTRSTRDAHWMCAVAPVLVTVVAILVLLYISGRSSLLADSQLAEASLVEVINAADSYFALLWGSLIGFVLAVVLAMLSRSLEIMELGKAITHGAGLMLSALVILWGAGALSTMTGNDEPSWYAEETAAAGQPDASDSQPYPFARDRLYTGDFLSRKVGKNAPLWALPTLIFLLSSAVAFATGTSWGTMAIVVPLAIPLVGPALGDTPEGMTLSPLLFGVTGSVLAGAIFGDHCSPISDTTVLSSQASGCDHIAHVRTQLPYALLVGGISILFGTLPVGLGVPVWLMLPLGTGTLVVLLRFLGKPVAEADSP